MKANKIKKPGNSVLLSRLRNIAIPAGIIAGVLCLYFYYATHNLNPICPVENVVFLENKRLTDGELREILGFYGRKSLLAVSSVEVGRRMLQSPWIRSASVRKEFPGTLAITIEENEPLALLDMNSHLFLIDENGKILEELKGGTIPFLPVIVSDPRKEKEGFSEALRLVRLLNDKGLAAGTEHIEVVAHKPNEIYIAMSEAVIKIGAGGYDEKLERLIHLKEELRGRNIPVDYIDLRFGNKAIVKPIAAKKAEE